MTFSREQKIYCGLNVLIIVAMCASAITASKIIQVGQGCTMFPSPARNRVSRATRFGHRQTTVAAPSVMGYAMRDRELEEKSSLITPDSWFENRPWIDEPSADIGRYVASLKERPTSYDLEEYLHRWRDDGIVVFRNAVDDQLIEQLLADVGEFAEHPDQYDLTIELQGKHRASREVSSDLIKNQTRLKLNCFHELSARAVEACLNAPAVNFLSHVFREPACVLQTLFFFRGSQQPVHLDYPYVRVQSIIAHLAASWLALEDISETSGPLAYYPGSHKPELTPPFDWGSGSIVMEQDSTKEPAEFSQHLYAEMDRLGIQPKVFLPKKGDVLLWHGYLAHEGTAVVDAESTRRSLVTHYSSLSAYPELHKYPDAEEKGRYLCLNGGYYFDAPWRDGARRVSS